MSLPALPTSAELVTPDAAVEIERHLAEVVPYLDDVETAREWLARADALASYLSHKDSQGPMLGAMRRIEARIGELLPQGKGGRGKTLPHTETFTRAADITEFRKLAAKVRRGILKYEEDGDDSPWRASRRALILGSGAFTGEATGEFEWYTPPEYIAAAREAMGGIDLDPASSAAANEIVGADRFYTIDDDGLSLPWEGRVWLNPPYSRPAIDNFCAKLVEEHAVGNVSQALVLTYSATETGWFHALAEVAAGVCFPRGRVKYWRQDPAGSAPLKGSAVTYLGPDADRFRSEFVAFGVTAVY